MNDLHSHTCVWATFRDDTMSRVHPTPVMVRCTVIAIELEIRLDNHGVFKGPIISQGRVLTT